MSGQNGFGSIILTILLQKIHTIGFSSIMYRRSQLSSYCESQYELKCEPDFLTMRSENCGIPLLIAHIFTDLEQHQ